VCVVGMRVCVVCVVGVCVCGVCVYVCVVVCLQSAEFTFISSDTFSL